MPERGETGAGQRAAIYCVIPHDLPAELHERLRRHFSGDPGVDVVVEQRTSDRRRLPDRRVGGGAVGSDSAADGRGLAPPNDRRRIRSATGRRVADRRAVSIAAGPFPLPRRARAHADRIVFVERLEPQERQLRDIDTKRLVIRYQRGEASVFGDIYMRYFDDVYAYAYVALRDHHEAEDATQQVFARALAALGRYEVRAGVPFRAWLFRIARHTVIDSAGSRARLQPEPPSEIDRRRTDDVPPPALDWLTDREIAMFVERLPQPQRQVLVLRFVLDFSTDEIAAVMERTPKSVRKLQSRALRTLEARLSAVGHGARRSGKPMVVRMRNLPVLAERRFALAGAGVSRPPGLGRPAVTGR